MKNSNVDPLKYVSSTPQGVEDMGESNTHVMSDKNNDYNIINNIITSDTDVNVFFDWIKFTIPIKSFNENGEVIFGKKEVLARNKILEILEILGVSEDQVYERDYGGSGYRSCLSISDLIFIFYDGGKTTTNKDGFETILVDITGSGCRFAESILKLDLLKLIQRFKIHHQASFTRIDFSCDIFTDKYFTLKQLFNKIIERHCVSPTSQFQFIMRSLDTDANFIGQTLYVGSMSSDRYLTIYDKKQEQLAKNDGIDIYLENWYRFELRFKQAWAKRLAVDLCNEAVDLRSFFSGLLFQFLDIKKYSRLDVADPSAIPTWLPWKRFLNHVNKITLTNQGMNESNFVKKAEWHRTNVSPFESQLFLFDQKNFVSNIFKNIGDYAEKFDKKRLSELNVERVKRGLSIISYNEAMLKLNEIKEEYSDNDTSSDV